MIRTAVGVGLIAHVAFWIILGVGVTFGEIRTRTAAVFAALWAVGVFGTPLVSGTAALFVTPYVAVLAIVLVLLVFKGDIPLS